MIVPDVITSVSREFDDSLSYITMNERAEDNCTVATPTPTVVNPNKRRRIMRNEPSLTEESNNVVKNLQNGWGAKVGIKESPTSPVGGTFCTTASFGVPLADFRDCESPSRPQHSFEDLSIELCKIVATDNYSRSGAIKALGNFCTWGYSDDAIFLDNFLELGGIQRVLIYLQNNKGDPLCVAMASKVIMACTFRTPSQKSYESANAIVKALAKRDGIQSLLDACSEYEGENMISQLEALRWIWAALMNITDKGSAYESSDPVALKDQLLSVFESGLTTMTKLGRNASPIVEEQDATTKGEGEAQQRVVRYNAVGGADYQLQAVQWIFSSLCGTNGSRKRAAMDMVSADRKLPAFRSKAAQRNRTRKAGVVDNSKMASMVMGIIFSTWSNIVHNSKLVREDFLGLGLLGKCIATLKSPQTGEWIRNKDLLIQASRFFVQCRENSILSTSEDFEMVFPLVVECIGKYPESSYNSGLFGFVKDAYSVLDRSFLQSSGVVRAVAIAWESERVDEATKAASHKLLKELL
eukprot:CAMPEP_0116108752 /NCGR_PEP_ID=MMETSP0327-20121206/16960_1 /TAXON_ID=44447 /ORGANISM="Pseudo-nitzschia delicatissima, Strain B596" /LENGTH=524 /DNA_ID=CAMNT_0003601699 /DNA_START=136 /DNA_END=1710 /DNA_ORIENTATION=+